MYQFLSWYIIVWFYQGVWYCNVFAEPWHRLHWSKILQCRLNDMWSSLVCTMKHLVQCTCTNIKYATLWTVQVHIEDAHCTPRYVHRFLHTTFYLNIICKTRVISANAMDDVNKTLPLVYCAKKIMQFSVQKRLCWQLRGVSTLNFWNLSTNFWIFTYI